MIIAVRRTVVQCDPKPIYGGGLATIWLSNGRRSFWLPRSLTCSVIHKLFRRKSFQCILFMDTTDSLCQMKLAEVMKVCTHSLTGQPFSDSRQPFHCLLLSFGFVRKHSRLNVLCLFHSSTLSNQSSWFFLDAEFL